MNAPVDARNPAEIYDEYFVPALFAQWGPKVAAAAKLGPGDRAFDVACGTGALTLAASEIVGPAGVVVGVDANPDMLAVARRKSSRIEWLEGKAEALPLPDRSFDAALSQFGFMFFEDRAAALREMMRALRPGGRLAVAVCGAVEESPGYAVLAKLLDDLFGREVGDAFRAPFALGDADALLAICEEAGVPDAQVLRKEGLVRFNSVEALVSTERACVWTLGGLLDDGQFQRLLKEAETALRPFETKEGVVFDMPALVIVAQTPAA